MRVRFLFGSSHSHSAQQAASHCTRLHTAHWLDILPIASRVRERIPVGCHCRWLLGCLGGQACLHALPLGEPLKGLLTTALLGLAQMQTLLLALPPPLVLLVVHPARRLLVRDIVPIEEHVQAARRGVVLECDTPVLHALALLRALAALEVDHRRAAAGNLAQRLALHVHLGTARLLGHLLLCALNRRMLPLELLVRSLFGRRTRSARARSLMAHPSYTEREHPLAMEALQI
mmetsp:Transcript_56050/g.154069  ORF Transcript_56050/g.154069 Transcript_56050/m.154069 type:complete len:232 (-) Transcript_56050:673-1368(-)